MAEKRPENMDEMARIGGVGAKKLESYGQAFLTVIGSDAPQMHPQRLKLAGRESADLFDRLQETMIQLSRGPDGCGKYLTISLATLRQIAERKPTTSAAMARISEMNDQKVERFASEFIAVLTESD